MFERGRNIAYFYFLMNHDLKRQIGILHNLYTSLKFGSKFLNWCNDLIVLFGLLLKYCVFEFFIYEYY